MRASTVISSNEAFGAPASPEAGSPERLSLVVRAVLALIRGYKLLLSPHFAGSCRFLPSCADYARDAVTLHGVVRGGWLAVKRLGRCHPLCDGGHDPVPGR